ncbi:MAG: MATE family efflux transporter, partial [Oscillospiraceae bacterium]|nr:MATE family efflux transporter [Oscillospiraceae bacterium]
FNWGAGRYDRVEESYRFAARAAVIGAAVMGVLLALFAQPLIALFAETDPEMRETGALAIRLQCLALPAHSWVAVVNMLCAGLGRAGGAVLLSTARQGTCFLPIVLPMAYFMGAAGVASVQAAADVLSIALAVPIIRRVRAQIREAAQQQEGGRL